MEQKNNITVHQAFYGEVKPSHGCINSTIKDPDLSSFLIRFTDRPGVLPAGIALESYYSATPYKDYYIFTLTFPDENASRGGMVFTHALILSLDELVYINDLEKIFGYFVLSIPDSKSQLAALSIEVFLFNNKDEPKVFKKYTQQTVEKLLTSNPPILFCGTLESFKNNITSLWDGLPFSFRKGISYTACFSVINLDSTKTILYFQKNLISSLKNQSFVSDEIDDHQEIISDVEKYLLLSDKDNAFESFLKEVNIDPGDWSILKSCVKAFQSYLKLDDSLTPADLKLLIRNIALISPNPANGQSIKAQILNKLDEYASSGKDDNIKSLRNLPLTSYRDGESRVSNLVIDFIRNSFKDSSFNTLLISELVVILNDATQNNWWYNALDNALRKTIETRDAKEVDNIWKVLIYSNESLHSLLRLTPSNKQDILIKHIPASIPKNMAEAFAKAIKNRKWFVLHAHLLLAYRAPKEAVMEQIELEETQPSSSFEGTFVLFKKLPDSDLKLLVFKENQEILVEEYSKRTVSNPDLLKGLNVNEVIWLKIWAKSLQTTNDLNHGITSMPEIIEQLLDLVSEGRNVNESIISKIAKSEFSDISGYTNRKDVWKNLPVSHKSDFLIATANGYIKKLLSGLTHNNTLETELQDYVIGDGFMSSFLNQYRNTIDPVLTVYEQISKLKDNFLSDYIKNFSGNVNDLQSSRLGNLIVSKGFVLSARQVLEKARYNEKFKIALAICKSLLHLNLLEQWLYGHLLGETITIDSAYSALAEISISLYGQGPEDIWKRSGGNISKLHNNKTREENWKHAIQLLRNGGGGKDVSAKSLVKEMLNDFPNNNQLKEILKYFKNH